MLRRRSQVASLIAAVSAYLVHTYQVQDDAGSVINELGVNILI